MLKLFLPISKTDMKNRGWDYLDIIIISGDAYVDHPAWGSAVIGRLLESKGYKVGIISQPLSDEDFTRLGRPKLFFGITSGNMDSMVNKYTAQKKIRKSDAYSPDGDISLRPDRALIRYSQKIRSLYKNVPIVLGGIEASLRRIPHYDYWSDKVRNSVLFDSRGDILIYGMGEKAIEEIADKLKNNCKLKEITSVRGTVVLVNEIDDKNGIELQEFPQNASKENYLKLYQKFYMNFLDKTLYIKFSKRYLKHNPPSKVLSQDEMDNIYSLNYTYLPHDIYHEKKISAFTQIRNSVTSHRGCFGGCNFCAIGVHQGKHIQSRSKDSIIDEITMLSKKKDFDGVITDIGGPSANMYKCNCKINNYICKRRSCIYPDICNHLKNEQKLLVSLLKEASKVNKVKHIFIGSGIRYDLALCDYEYIKQITNFHVSGRIKLAPEHNSDDVLEFMYKPKISKFEEFKKIFEKISKDNNKNQSIVPYIIVGHPGETLDDTIQLALYLKKNNFKIKQVQEFTPTPMSISTCMYYTGLDFSNRKIHIPKGREIRLMKALVQYFIPENKKYIVEALRKTKKMKLIKNLI